MIVIGAGATGVQVASIFNAFGSQVHLYQSGPRILPTEDEDISQAVAQAFRESGITVLENFGTIDSFEKTSSGLRMTFSKDGAQTNDEAAIVIAAIGWVADTAGLNLSAAGVQLNDRGYVSVDSYLRTSASHIFAAGDIRGRLMLLPQATTDGYSAATNAVLGTTMTVDNSVNPIGSFTDPEYAQVGLSEVKARETHDVFVSTVSFAEAIRPTIDGRTTGFCKLIVDRTNHTILGCHIVGERAVEITQMAAIAMGAGMRIEDLVRIPLSFPTYTGVFLRAAYQANCDLRGGAAAGQSPDLLNFAA
jgi:dihydrolipoamide dehydrogenase